MNVLDKIFVITGGIILVLGLLPLFKNVSAKNKQSKREKDIRKKIQKASKMAEQKEDVLFERN